MKYTSQRSRNVNLLRNKTEAFREICKNFHIDILCIDKAKLDCSFLYSIFKIDGCQYPPFGRDRSNRGVDEIVYVQDGLLVKRLKNKLISQKNFS